MHRTHATARAAAIILCLACLLGAPARAADAPDTNGIIVYQSDFGLKDGAVSAMRGVAVSVDPTLRLEDLTHEIPAFDIWADFERRQIEAIKRELDQDYEARNGLGSKLSAGAHHVRLSSTSRT